MYLYIHKVYSPASVSVYFRVEFRVIYARLTVTKIVIYSFISKEDKLFRCVRDKPPHVVHSEEHEKRALRKCGGS